ncbi:MULTISPECIES: hypothetical protein [Dyella]|uniref:Uncharacterized protein n=1 Tax=Dyella lutea TaxID=2950441 RepID=A0ABT1F559_9GAMM|nr:MULTISPECIES: hypothetical protein [Dyella]MCP1372525.1 hypothetical protein [Dyella lutea]
MAFLKVVFLLAALVALLIAPVMYTARALGAQRTTIGPVLGSLVLQVILSRMLNALHFGGMFVHFILALAGGALIYQWVLETTFLKGVAISLISSVIMLVGALVILKMAIG